MLNSFVTSCLCCLLQAVRYGPGGHYHCHYDSHSLHAEATCCDRRSLDECRICRSVVQWRVSSIFTGFSRVFFPLAQTPSRKTRKNWWCQGYAGKDAKKIKVLTNLDALRSRRLRSDWERVCPWPVPGFRSVERSKKRESEKRRGPGN